MAQTKVSINQAQFRKLKEKLRDLSKPADKETAVKVGKIAVKGIRDDTARGQSPILGKGKYPKYKNPKRYPGKRKSASPVNLRLSGRFMRSLSYKTQQFRNGWRTFIGYFDDLSDKIEEGHRRGVNKQPKRPSVPSAKGERFNTKIARDIFRIFSDRVRQIAKKR